MSRLLPGTLFLLESVFHLMFYEVSWEPHMFGLGRTELEETMLAPKGNGRAAFSGLLREAACPIDSLFEGSEVSSSQGQRIASGGSGSMRE